MERIKTFLLTRWTPVIAVLTLVLIISSCFEIVVINQPATANVGEEITITIDANVTDVTGSTLVFGFLAPRAWRPAENTSVSFVSSIGNSTMSLMPPNELDANNNRPWKPQLEENLGFGANYGEVEWVVFKADTDYTPPDGTSPENPVTGTITVKTRVGSTNMKTQLGYFLGDALWGYLEDEGNSTSMFFSECIEITGAGGSPQNLCGPAPRQLIKPSTFTFDDILTVVFDAQEDATALIGANKVFFCSKASHDGGLNEVCEFSSKTEMKRIGPDLWSLKIWPKSFYNIPDGNSINEILANFQDESGNTIVKDINTGEDFQIIPKCF